VFGSPSKIMTWRWSMRSAVSKAVALAIVHQPWCWANKRRDLSTLHNNP
jgi:hypothetical protein